MQFLFMDIWDLREWKLQVQHWLLSLQMESDCLLQCTCSAEKRSFVYGSHIEVGENFFANYNCTIIDVSSVRIGDNCFMAPNVAVYTAGHPVHPDTRNSMFEYGKEVTIEDNV